MVIADRTTRGEGISQPEFALQRNAIGNVGEGGGALVGSDNQIGTVSETLEVMQIARSAGFDCIMSHRSGETCDSSISDLAVGTGCGWIKTGAPARSDRTSKYNQLIRIEEQGLQYQGRLV